MRFARLFGWLSTIKRSRWVTGRLPKSLRSRRATYRRFFTSWPKRRSCSRRGVGGGFQLIPSPDELTVLDVVNAVDPLRRINACPLKLKSHCEQLCPMHARLDETLALVEQALASSTIREVMFDPARPLPLRNP